MNFSQLVESNNFESQFGLNMNSRLIVYLHIPKAAGNSSIKPIKEKFKSNLSIKWNEIEFSWSKFIEEQKSTNKYQFVSGHIHDKQIDLLKQSEINYYLISFLRHPIKRIMSLYAYNTMESTPDSKKFKEKFVSFEDFAFNGVPPNSMSRQLFRGCLSSTEGISKLYTKYNFIGLTEQFNFSMLLLSKILGFDFYNYKKLNVSKYNTTEMTLSFSLYKELEMRHSIDLEIYNKVKNDYVKLNESYIVTQLT